MPFWTHFGPELPRRNRGDQIPHAHQVVGGAAEGKDPVHFAYSAMSQLPHERDRLQPSETFFDSFSLLLTEGITRVPRCPLVNRTPAAPSQVLRHVWHYPQMAALGHEP